MKLACPEPGTGGRLVTLHNQSLCHTAEEFQRLHLGANPVGRGLPGGGTGVGVVGGAKGGGLGMTPRRHGSSWVEGLSWKLFYIYTHVGKVFGNTPQPMTTHDEFCIW